MPTKPALTSVMVLPGHHRPHRGAGMVVMRSNTAMRPSTPGWKPVMDQQRDWSACLLPTDADPQARTSSRTDACEVIVILRHTIQRFRWSGALLWAWEDLNLRPHPYQRSTANRCAIQPFRWSCSSVSPTGWGELAVRRRAWPDPPTDRGQPKYLGSPGWQRDPRQPPTARAHPTSGSTRKRTAAGSACRVSCWTTRTRPR